ncbi:MAG: hypothetical protein AAF437_01680 [Pseudomonadota bacterium]
MLLRRITQHVKDQNWFAVVLDFVIVVFGVFMGFQVQQWNEHRKNLSDTHEYLARLAADMEISTARNDFQISTSQNEIKQLDLILSSLRSCQLSEEDKPAFTAGLYNMGKYDLPAMVMSTIDELNATGKFQLIGDVSLKRQISETVREYNTTLSLDSQFSARTIPSVNYVRTRVSFSFDEHFNRPDKLDPSKANYDFQQLCNDTTFINAISTVREMTLATEALNRLTLDNQTAILAALAKN